MELKREGTPKVPAGKPGRKHLSGSWGMIPGADSPGGESL
jgi:hypothetical protein